MTGCYSRDVLGQRELDGLTYAIAFWQTTEELDQMGFATNLDSKTDTQLGSIVFPTPSQQEPDVDIAARLFPD